MSQDIALYIHVPFCRQKCYYCSFVSYERREADIPVYLHALAIEMTRHANGEQVKSIYFGGGTPSLLSPIQIMDILFDIRQLYSVVVTVEITMEANPGTVSLEYLSAIREAGINRLSLGIQSFSDTELTLMGRIHTGDEARQAVHLARLAGLGNLNLDLIYGLPGQSLSDWRHTLEVALALEAEHLSIYGLSLESETMLWQAVQNKTIPVIDPDISADQYELAEETLAKHGYRHYEISNWARPGYKCRHNLTYWHNHSYLGVGAAAHSFIKGHRLSNTDNLDKYLAAFPDNPATARDTDEEISPQLQLAETVILGLRLCDGLSLDGIFNRFGVDLFEYYQQPVAEMGKAGLLEWTPRQLRLTRRGRLLSNEVFWRFLPLLGHRYE
ncbi:radical SAM family heme chaperone HemW [Chloroflexota bacterium]